MFVVSATPLTLLKLCVCFLHDMRMCMWFAYNCCINFCQFSPFIYRLCEHIPYNTIPILCPLLKLMLNLCPPPPPPPPPPGGRCDTALRGILVINNILLIILSCLARHFPVRTLEKSCCSLTCDNVRVCFG